MLGKCSRCRISSQTRPRALLLVDRSTPSRHHHPSPGATRPHHRSSRTNCETDSRAGMCTARGKERPSPRLWSPRWCAAWSPPKPRSCPSSSQGCTTRPSPRSASSPRWSFDRGNRRSPSSVSAAASTSNRCPRPTLSLLSGRTNYGTRCKREVNVHCNCFKEIEFKRSNSDLNVI